MVRMILIDNGNSTDIMSAHCLSRLKFDDKNLVPVHHSIIRFFFFLGGGEVIYPMEMVTL